VGEHIGRGFVEQGGELGQLETELVGDLVPLGPAALASSCATAVAMKAATTRRPLLTACAMTLRMKWTRQRCQEAVSTLLTAALHRRSPVEAAQATASKLAQNRCERGSVASCRSPASDWGGWMADHPAQLLVAHPLVNIAGKSAGLTIFALRSRLHQGANDNHADDKGPHRSTHALSSRRLQAPTPIP
jgi:hypothetical protein